MMHQRRRVHIWKVSTPAHSALLLLGCCFMAGGLLGMGVASQISADGNLGLSSYITSYLQAFENGYCTVPSLFSLLLEQFRYPLLVFLLSFTALGVIGIPLVLGIRGFLLAFAAAAFCRMFGPQGVLLAAVLFGFTNLIAVPALFVLGTLGWLASFRASQQVQASKGRRCLDRIYFVRCGICCAAIFISALFECFCVPAFFTKAAYLFLSL